MNKVKPQTKPSTWDQSTEDAFVLSIVNKLQETINQLDTKLRAKCLDKFYEIESGVGNITALKIVSSIREILSIRKSKKLEEETIRSTIISAVCGSQVPLKKVSSAIRIITTNLRNILNVEKLFKR